MHKDLFFVDSVRDVMCLVAELPIHDPEVHTFPLTRIVNRVLAQDYRAPFPVPGFRRSRLDGYALRSADLETASGVAPVRLHVTACVPAGTWPVPDVEPGSCVRIMAGAALPASADAVVGFEHVLPLENGAAGFTAPVPPGAAVGSADVDAKQGELLVGRGTRLIPLQMGRLASVGTINVPVFSRPRVAVLSTGSELLLSGMPPSPGRIYNTNQCVICGMLSRNCAIPLPCGIARDDAGSIANTVRLAVQDSTMLITTGGVGRGDCDCIRDALETAGCEIILGGARFRPGGNMILSRLNGKYILSLTGAPGSALIGVGLVAIPLLRRLTGDSSWRVPEVDVILKSLPSRKPQGLVAGRLVLEGGLALLEPMPMLAMERRPMELILPLEGGEDLEAMVRERRPARAFWLRDQA